MATLKVIFAGTPQNAAETLIFLHSSGINIVGVLTRADSQVGREKILTESPVASVAKELNLQVVKANKIDGSVLETLRSFEADLGVVVAYGCIFGREALDVPRLGWINLHYSLLPKFPGPAPVQHALFSGQQTTGVTVFRLDEGIDTGPIVSQVETDIEDSDNSESLLARLTTVGSSLLRDVLVAGDQLISQATMQIKVNEPVVATKPTRAMAKLNFHLDARSQYNKIRAMNPEPMSWFETNGSAVRVLIARLALDHQIEVSTMQLIGKELFVGCLEGSLILETVQPAGKKAMSAADWFRGLRLERLTV